MTSETYNEPRLQTIKPNCSKGHYVAVHACDDPKCGQPHLLFYDVDENPILEFVLSNETLDILRNWGRQ